MTSFRPQTFGFLALLLGACTQPAVAPRPAVVATVGADVILASELREELERVGLEAGGETEPAVFSDLRDGVLDALVERRLLLAEARATGVVVTDDEVERLVARRAAAAAQASVADAIPSPAEMESRLREQLLVDRLLVREVVGRTALGPDEARKWYDEHREQLGRGERVRARQIVTRTNEEAQAVRKEALRGVDFEALAREHSIVPDAKAGGDLGWFSRGQMPPVVEDASFALRKNQIGEVVSSPWGYHVFKVIERDDGAVPSFAAAEKSIELELRRRAVARAQSEYVANLRKRVGVVVHEAELARVLPRRTSEFQP